MGLRAREGDRRDLFLVVVGVLRQTQRTHQPAGTRVGGRAGHAT